MRKPEFAEKLYIDFDSFFASVEQHLNPELRGRPVGVIPLDSDYSSCIAASYDAKKFGVKTGTRMKDARDMCPGIRFVVARHDIYVRLHHRIVAAVESCVPVSKTRSIDEMVCNLMLSESRDAAGLATRIKQRVEAEIGQGLPCSIGIAPTELLAKIAAEMDKPNGFVVFEPDDLPGRLFELELRDLPGISSGIERRLHQSGIKDVKQLWALEAKHMRAIWGNVEGERFWASLHGYETIREDTKRRMFGHGRILPRDWRSPQRAFTCGRMLMTSAARRLRRENFRACNLNYGLRSVDRQKWSADIRFTAARDDATFLHAMQALHLRFEKERPFSKIKSVSVTLHGLVAPEQLGGAGFMEDLFDKQSDIKAHGKWEAASDTMDALRERFGAKALTLGPVDQMPGGYVGGKIAFNRIPDMRDFNENIEESSRAIIRS